MAESVEEAPPLGTNRRYDWPSWANGQIWRLMLGVDYDAPHRVIAAGRNYAAAHRLRMKVRTEPGSVYVQFTPRDG